MASVSAAANGTIGMYTVSAGGAGIAESASFALGNTEAPSLVVTTTQDETDPYDGETSLREATAYADSLPGSPTITFAPSLAGETIDLTTVGDTTVGSSALAIAGTVVIDGSTAPGLTITQSGVGPIFYVSATGDLTMQDLTISGGQDDLNSPYSGGGALLNFGTATLINDTVSDNFSRSYGGGLLNRGTVTLIGDDFADNFAGSNGGGLTNFAAATLTNDTFSDNSAQYDGGLFNRGTLTLTNSIFASNTAQDGGGGLENDSTATLTNDTFTNNSSQYNGGGALLNFGTTALTNDTFTDNSAQYGGGVFNDGTVTLNNTIVAGNFTAGLSYAASPNEITGSDSVSGANNLIGDPNTRRWDN